MLDFRHGPKSTLSSSNSAVPPPLVNAQNRRDRENGFSIPNREQRQRQNARRGFINTGVVKDGFNLLRKSISGVVINSFLISGTVATGSFMYNFAANFHANSVNTDNYLRQAFYLYPLASAITCGVMAAVTLGALKLNEIVYKRLLTNLIKPLENDGTLLNQQEVRSKLVRLAKMMGTITGNSNEVKACIKYIEEKHPIGSQENRKVDNNQDLQRHLNQIQSRYVLKTKVIKFLDSTIMRPLFSGIGHDAQSATDNAKKSDLGEAVKDTLKAMGEIWRWSVGGPGILGTDRYMNWVKPEVNVVLSWFNKDAKINNLKKPFEFQSSAIKYHFRNSLEPAFYGFSLAGGASLLTAVANYFIKNEAVGNLSYNLMNVAKSAWTFCQGNIGSAAFSVGIVSCVIFGGISWLNNFFDRFLRKPAE